MAWWLSGPGSGVKGRLHARCALLCCASKNTKRFTGAAQERAATRTLSYYLSRSYASSSKAQRSNAHRTCERSFMIKSLQVARYGIYYGRMNSLVRVEMLFFLLLPL